MPVGLFVAAHDCRIDSRKIWFGIRILVSVGKALPMPGDPKECRQRALNCMLLAKEATTEKLKQTFLNLAQSWTRLAVELEDAGMLLKSLSEIELANAPALESLSRPDDAGPQPKH
jgi:hypothetical protein